MNEPLAPLSWRELLAVNRMRMFTELRDSFSQASPLPTRAFVVAATLMAACGLWWDGESWAKLYVFEAMRITAPRWLWALAFTVGGIGQLWRLIDDTPRFWVGLMISAHVCACWLLVSIELLISGSLFVAMPALTLAAQAAWITIRTGATHVDRSRA